MACAKPVQVLDERGVTDQKSVTLVDVAEIPKKGRWKEQVARLIENPERALRIPFTTHDNYDKVRSGLYHAARAVGAAVRIERFERIVFVRLLHAPGKQL